MLIESRRAIKSFIEQAFGVDAMLQPLRDHVINLEQRIQTLRNELTHPALSVEECELIGFKMRLSELALRHYIKGYELERKGE